MRLFILCTPDVAGLLPYISAEVVREFPLVDDRSTSYGGALAGVRAELITREELLASPVGTEALRAWDDDDDSAFDRETIALADDSKPDLRLIDGGATDQES